jgi:hypothetical protein
MLASSIAICKDFAASISFTSWDSDRARWIPGLLRGKGVHFALPHTLTHTCRCDLLNGEKCMAIRPQQGRSLKLRATTLHNQGKSHAWWGSVPCPSKSGRESTWPYRYYRLPGNGSRTPINTMQIILSTHVIMLKKDVCGTIVPLLVPEPK